MAKRRLPPAVWISAVFGVGAVVAGVAMVSGLGRGTLAPEDKGICWRMIATGGKPQYVQLAKDVANLETCAAHLERLFIQAGGEVSGAYQGRFLFVDERAIRSGTSLEGSRWQVFFAPQRAALDKKLREGGKTPQMFMMPAR
ncbi:MAG TPA: hypothetical protein VL460_06750 [Caulobacteraceae bacterium]|jgi:hypothetical protein|nr:hypothetical protein [Caulobacteraceae bacterium]